MYHNPSLQIACRVVYLEAKPSSFTVEESNSKRTVMIQRKWENAFVSLVCSLRHSCSQGLWSFMWWTSEMFWPLRGSFLGENQYHGGSMQGHYQHHCKQANPWNSPIINSTLRSVHLPIRPQILADQTILQMQMIKKCVLSIFLNL